MLPFSVEEVEALACSKALLFAREIGITKAEIKEKRSIVRDILRLKLQLQCIKYLGPAERKAYEVVVQDGKLIFNHSGVLKSRSFQINDSIKSSFSWAYKLHFWEI
nr:iq domain-containing protein iqm2 [Quercus suber]